MPTSYQIPSKGYQQRLRRLLANEDYGPKLVRLPKKQQQEVLQLINTNQGRQARQLILNLDEERRTRQRGRPRRTAKSALERARRYANLKKHQRTEQWGTYKQEAATLGDSSEFWSLYSGLV